MIEYRCSVCKRLLYKWDGTDLKIEIKCECGAFNTMQFVKITKNT
jgi:hypothetical protein